MDSEQLKALQAPLKAKYTDDASAAVVTLKADGQVGEGVSCSLNTSKALIEAGLHPATGGSGTQVCSGDMLLEALVACPGVTLAAVSTALGIDIGHARVHAEGDLDFRGTLGVDKEAPVGFRAIRLSFELGDNITDEQRATLVKLTERYCVVLQTLKGGVELTTTATSA
ncbi:MAG: OsmC family protein [Pseudomonadota bacterium]